MMKVLVLRKTTDDTTEENTVETHQEQLLVTYVGSGEGSML